MTENMLAILGAADSEMEMIESLLRECGVPVAYAMVDGKRVHPGNAYAADNLDTAACQDLKEVIYVECSPADGFDPHWAVTETLIDHHRPGDPGYGKPPSEFLSASSIGQVISLLARLGLGIFAEDGEFDQAGGGFWFWLRNGQWQVNLPYASAYMTLRQEWVLCAAADHCLAAAYRGECPGVDPDALMRWRVASRAKFQKRSEESILADVAQARMALLAADEISLGHDPDCQLCAGEGHYFDCHGDSSASGQAAEVDCMCGPHVADFTQQFVPELPEAAAREGISFLSLLDPAQAKLSGDPTVNRNTRKKYFLSGTAKQVQWFLDHFPAEGKYGDPARGFAGGYVPEP